MKQILAVTTFTIALALADVAGSSARTVDDARFARFEGDRQDRHAAQTQIISDTPTATAPQPAMPPAPSGRTAPRMDLGGALMLLRLTPGADLNRAGLAGWQAAVTVYPFES